MLRLLLALALIGVMLGCNMTPGVESKPPPPGGPPKTDRHPPGLPTDQQGKY